MKKEKCDIMWKKNIFVDHYGGYVKLERLKHLKKRIREKRQFYEENKRAFYYF